MKKIIAALVGLGLTTLGCQAQAVSLMQVYRKALQNDQKFKQALSQEQSTAEKVPQSIAVLLPQIAFGATGTLSKQQTKSTGTNIASVNSGYFSNTERDRGYNYDLSLKQNIFNFTYWKNLSSAKATVKAAVADYNAAAQDLMKRTAQAYFAVLQAKDVLRFTAAEKRAYYQQYIQAKQSFKVGVKTITDVYNAKAAYDAAVASYVKAKNDIANREEDLRVITGVMYWKLDPLKAKIPLVKPYPSNINTWVDTANRQSWKLVAARYNTLAAHENVWSKRGGHMPTVDLSASYDKQYTRTFDVGRTKTQGPSAELDLNLPIFEGGQVNSEVRQAIADYELAQHTQEQAYRDVENQTRKDYLGVISGISEVQAQKQSVISFRSSLEGMEEGYRVGTRTIVDVLYNQKQLYEAEKNHANARYKYILDSISLKESAGTLNVRDLRGIDGWLDHYYWHHKPVYKHRSTAKKSVKRKSVKRTSNYHARHTTKMTHKKKS